MTKYSVFYKINSLIIWQDYLVYCYDNGISLDLFNEICLLIFLLYYDERNT